MKAPDKIYIPKNLAPHLTEEWASHTHGSLDEYIRKDALMEWAKDHQEGERQGSYTWSCYQIILDKLNEM